MNIFITFEGLDGSGKTTLIKEAVKYIKEKYIEDITKKSTAEQLLQDLIHTTKEPSNTDIGKYCREYIDNTEHYDANVLHSLLFADGKDKELKLGIGCNQRHPVIISDRCAWSSFAYGSAMGGYTSLMRHYLMLRNCGTTIYLDAGDKNQERISKRASRSIVEAPSIQKEVKKNYEWLLDNMAGYHILKTDKPIEETVIDLHKIIDNIFNPPHQFLGDGTTMEDFM